MSVKSWLENLILAEEKNRRVVRCLELTEEPLAAKNKNYMSDISRLRMSVELGSGVLTELAFVAKKIPESPSMRDMYDDYQITGQEIMSYENLGKMDRLMKENEDFRENLWGQFLGCFDSVLVFEDLTAKGYKPYNKSGWLDEEHSKFVLRELARYHAMGVAAVETKTVDTNIFRPLYFLDKRSQDNFFLPGVKSLRDGVLNWGPEWSESVTQLNQIVDHLDETMRRLDIVNQKTLNVIGHGDCWRGNMLFKHDIGGQILSMKFVDFQIACYCSYVFDLFIFLLSSVEHELRWRDLDVLLETYRESLIANMKFYNLDSSKAPTIAEMKDTLEFLLPVTITTMTLYWPVTANEIEVKVSDVYDEDSTFLRPEMYLSERSKQILGIELKKMHGKNILL